MATIDEIGTISRELNRVSSAGQARAAIGAALRALSAGYPMASSASDADRAARMKRSLDDARIPLERWYGEIKSPADAPYAKDFARRVELVRRAYVTLAGVEAEASYVPQTSNLQILIRSIKEAPTVFARGVGEVAKGVGNVAGDVAGGVVTGLGIGGTATLIGAGLLVLWILKSGGPAAVLGKVV